MINIQLQRGKFPEQFEFLLCENGEQVGTCYFEELSTECVRLVKASGKLSTELNAALTRKAYDMGYRRMLFYAAPAQKVTRLARLQRKTTGYWAYLIPLEELYGGNN